MIQRLLIDNYACCVNFDCPLASLQLLIGENGSGKTTVFDVLWKLRHVIANGLVVASAFPSQTLTAWDSRDQQTFEIDVAGNGGVYRYRLVIEHDRVTAKNRIQSERLSFDETRLYEFDGRDAHLFRDDGSAGPVFPFDWSRSAISTVPERSDNQRLTWFRRRMERVWIFSLDPTGMLAASDSELADPDRRLYRLSSWLRHLHQEQGDTLTVLCATLADGVLDGLVGLRLERAGENTRVLKFDFQHESGTPYSLSLDQLSDGQRQLVALFAILATVLQPDSTVCLDEPDNYVALREIQPWLTQLRDRVEDSEAQCLLISHHPEYLNYLAAHHGLLFERDDSGAVRSSECDWPADELLTPAELAARGW